MSETHTLSGESSAHSCTSQPKLGVFGGAGWRVELGREAQGRSEQAESRWLILAEELLSVFNEADDHHYGGAGHAHEEHDLQDVHCKQSDLKHEHDCNPDDCRFPFSNIVPIERFASVLSRDLE